MVAMDTTNEAWSFSASLLYPASKCYCSYQHTLPVRRTHDRHNEFALADSASAHSSLHYVDTHALTRR